MAIPDSGIYVSTIVPNSLSSASLKSPVLKKYLFLLIFYYSLILLSNPEWFDLRKSKKLDSNLEISLV